MAYLSFHHEHLSLKKHADSPFQQELEQILACDCLRAPLSFKLLFSIYSQCILITPLHHEVFILANTPQEYSLKTPQPLACFTFIVLGRRGTDCLEVRPCFLNILNHLLSVFWQGTFFSCTLRLPARHGRNSKRHWEQRSVSYSKCTLASAAGKLPLFK